MEVDKPKTRSRSKSKPKPRQKRKREDEEVTDSKKVKCEDAISQEYTLCSSIPDWIYFLAYGSLVSAVRDTIPNHDVESEFRLWWKSKMKQYCATGNNIKQMEMKIRAMEAEIAILLGHAFSAYRGSSIPQPYSLGYLNHWVRIATRRVICALVERNHLIVPGVLFGISTESYKKVKANRIGEGEWTTEVVSVKPPKDVSRDAYAIPVDPSLYSMWMNTKAHIFIHCAILYMVENIRSIFPPCVASLEDADAAPPESEPQSPSPKPKPKQSPTTTPGTQSPVDTSCPSYFGESHKPTEALDEVEEAIRRTGHLITRLDHLYDVNFVLGLNNSGEEVKPQDRTVVKGHAVYFAAVSPWFQRMIEGAMAESRREVKVDGGTVCVQPDIHLPTVSPRVFKAIQMWAYGGGSAAAIEVADELLPQLVDVSLSLELNKLFELCLDYLGVYQLNHRDICHLTEFVYTRLFHREYSEVYVAKFKKLYELCINYIVCHFVDLCLQADLPEESLRSCSSRKFWLSQISKASRQSNEKTKDKEEEEDEENEEDDEELIVETVGIDMEWFPLDLVKVILERVGQHYAGTDARVEPATLLFVLRWCMVQDWFEFGNLLRYVRLQFFCPRFLMRHMNSFDFRQSCPCTEQKREDIIKNLERTPCCFFYHKKFYTEEEQGLLKKVQKDVTTQIFHALSIQHGIRPQGNAALEERLTRFLKKIDIHSTEHNRCECNTLHANHALFCLERYNCTFGTYLLYHTQIRDYSESFATAPCCLFYDLYYYLTSTNPRSNSALLQYHKDDEKLDQELCDAGLALLLSMEAEGMEVAGS